MSILPIIKFAIARRLNIYKGNREYRAIYCRRGQFLRVVMRRRNGNERGLTLRAHTSDLQVFHDVFHKLQYSTQGFARESDVAARYRTILAASRRPLIIDAGANIGLAALYYRDIYPEAVIVCIEPEPENFIEIRRNIGNDKSMLLLQAALAGRDGEMEVFDPGNGAWGFRTRHPSATSDHSMHRIPALSVETIIDLASERWPVEPFILKVDIEGGESDVFQTPACWIDRFYVVIVELHDWMLPRERSSTAFISAMAGRDRDFLLKGENVFSISNSGPGDRAI